MKWITNVRYFFIRLFIGKMTVIANADISNWDFYDNMSKHSSEPHMFYGNQIYLLERRIHQNVYTGNKGKVKRSGNAFVLEE